MCYCGQNFYSKELETHIKTTHEGQGWLCGDSSCTKIYENKNVLFKHVGNKHLLLFNFKCDKCPKSYEEWNSLRAHLDEKHGIPAPDMHCSKCNKLFYQKNKLLVHENICKTKVKALKCTEQDCDYRCRSKRSLQHHYDNKNPLGGKNILRFPCGIEDFPKIFSWKEGLHNHMTDKHPAYRTRYVNG